MKKKLLTLKQLDPRGTLAKRFWSKVDKNGEDGRAPGLGKCWHWTGHINNKGYGRINCGSPTNGTEGPRYAHRISWALINGREPSGCMLHMCDNPKCVRPAHLFQGTHKQNSQDMVRKNRSCRGERHGSRKHPERVPKGQDHFAAKFTDADVRAMRAERAAGATLAELCNKYPTDLSHMSKIVRGLRWAHVA